MATRKAAPKPAAAQTVSTIGDDDRTVPSISPELVEARQAELDREPKVKVTPREDPSISPELVEAREAALKAEKTRKTF